MRKICLLIMSIFLFNTLCFAQIKTFTKQGESVVQKDQSVNQVISYLKQKLTREAQEEAGIFITTNLKIENYQITKDEFTSFAGSISRTKILEENSFMKNAEQYVKVRIRVDIDIDNVKAYLEKIMQDNEYKEQAQKAIKEAEELRKEKLELEEKLKTATKKQYEQELSTQVQQQVELQKQREIELNKMAIQAKEEFVKIKEEQNKKTQERENELLKLKEQIAQEKDNVKKAELENQAKIKELELRAKENQKSWSSNKNKISIQGAIEEATKVKQETDEIINKFETLLKENKDKITKSYDEQIQLSCNNSKKGQWETEEEYKIRLDKNKQITEKIQQEKEENLFEDERKTIKSMITTLRPFIEKLQYFQTEKFYDEKGSKAELLSIGEVNIDDQYFVVNIKYNKKKYRLNYDFSKIGKEQAKLLCQTQNQFVIEPLFSVNNKLKEELVAFNVRHLGTKEEKILDTSTKIKQFSEIKRYNDYKNNKKYEIFDTLNKEIQEFKNKDELKYFTDVVKNLEKLKKLLFISSDEETVYSVEKYIDNLNDLNIAVAKRGKIIVGLKRNGVACVFYCTTTHSYHRKFDGSYTYSDGIRLDAEGEFNDIVSICVYGRNDVNDTPICMNKNGEIITNYKYIIKYKKEFRWAKDITSSYGADLKRDGTVFIYDHKVEEFSIKIPEKLEKILKTIK